MKYQGFWSINSKVKELYCISEFPLDIFNLLKPTDYVMHQQVNIQ